MAAVYTKIYKRLKHSGFPLGDRLKLLKYAWKSDNVNIPNKEQDLIDVLGSLLVNKKQNHLTDEETEQVWNCLYDILSTRKAHQPSKYGQTLIIKPVLSRVLLDSLQSYVGKMVDKICCTVLRCCQTILTSPTLSYVLTSKYDSLATLLAVLCHLTCQQWGKDSWDVIQQSLQLVLKAYSAVQRRVLNQNMVRQTVTEKIVVPLLSVWYLNSLQDAFNSKDEKMFLHKFILDLINSSYLHQNHLGSMKKYLDSETDDQSKTVAKQIILVTLSDITHKENVGNHQLQESISQFIPEFYTAFLQLDSFDSDYQFKMFIVLCEILGFNNNIEYSATLPQNVALKGLNSLLQLIQEADVYNVAVDNEKGKVQLKFYTNLLRVLLTMKRCSEWYNCLMSLLSMNHEIIQENMMDVLKNAWLYETNPSLQSNIDGLMAAIVTIYGKLHQEQKWLNYIFTAIDSCNKPNIVTMTQFYNSFADVVGRIHQTLITQIWSLFSEKIKTLLESIDDETVEVCFRLNCIVNLFQHFVANISVIEYSVSNTTHRKIVELIHDVERNILKVIFKSCIKKNNEDLLKCGLLLCITVGDIKLLLLRYTKIGGIFISQSEDETNILHSYLKLKNWQKIAASITSSNCEILQHLMDLLSVQKIRSCLVLNKDNIYEVVNEANVLNLPSIVNINLYNTWNGKIELVNKENGELCRWVLLTEIYPLVITFLTDKQIEELADFIIYIIVNTKHISEKNKETHSFYYDCMKFLYSSPIEDTRKLHSCLINSLLKHIFVDTTLDSPKKKKATAALIGSEQKIEWHKTMERETLSCLTCIVTTVLKRLNSDTIDQHLPIEILYKTSQVLKALPISSFKEAEKLRTIYVCILIINFLEKKLTNCKKNIKQLKTGMKRKSDVKKEDNESIEHLLCDYMCILSILFESCNRVAVFQLLSPTPYFIWLIQLYTHCFKQDKELKYKMQCLVDMSCYAVLVNVDVLLTMGEYIKQLVTSIEDLPLSDDSQEAKIYILASLVKELTSHYESEFVRDDVSLKCKEYIKTISDTVISTLIQQDITVHTITLVTRIIHFNCLTEQIKHNTHLIHNIQFILQTVLQRLHTKQTKDDLDIYLKYLSTLYIHSTYLSTILNQHTTLQVWQAILSHSKTQSVQNTASTPTISKSIHSLMALVIRSCDEDNFKKIINQIVHDVCVPCCPGENKIQSALLIWKEILTLSLTPVQGLIISDVTPTLLINCGNLLQDVIHLDSSECIINIVLPVLTTQASMLSYGNMLMKPHVAVLCLNSCHLVNLELRYELIIPVFKGLADIVYSFFINHGSTAVAVIPTIISVTKLLYKVIAQYGDQDRLTTYTDYKEDICVCANLITRLCNLYSKEKVGFGKVAMYVVVDYCTEVQKVTLLPVVKKALVPSIYHLLDICDDHRIKQLQAILPQGVKDVFLMLYNDYVKYHKYTGKS
ncbi:unhealthy ribosome biogenesis protein 2 homolog [Patella vulgata]|uniref:unhealthy ribosome biogenesis protein 2 homolog n=1 Tax=Patella vulgata TaxID=6465 RepID=UPI0021803E87|nr:unhealthy ribosome biogenesis protein 2 homolog [Patella vulgata]